MSLNLHTEVANVLLMGPKSLESIVGAKPAIKAQLDSVAFKIGMVLQILRSDQFIDGILCFLVKALPSFRIVFFCIFSWVGLIWEMQASINQIDKHRD